MIVSDNKVMSIAWWDFSDSTFLIFFIIVASVAFVALFIVISIYIYAHWDRRMEKKIIERSNSIRVFDIDLKRNSVTFFNRSNLRNRKMIDLSHFYASFHPNDVEKIKEWICTITMNPKDAEEYLEVDVLTSKSKKNYFSLLKLLKYDPKVGIIHLESTLLKHITPNNAVSKRHGPVVGYVKRSVIADMVSKNHSLRGFTFAIRFFYKKQKITANDKIERLMMMSLKNVVYPFVSDTKSPRQIMEAENNEIFIFDLRMSNKDEAWTLANSMATQIRKCIGLNSYADLVDFAIGVVENGLFYQDFDSIIEKAEETCLSYQQNSVGNNVIIAQKNANSLIENKKYEQDVLNLLKPGTLRYLFRPIFNVSKSEVVGYFSYVRGYNTPFVNYLEMSKYAARMGKNRDLFALTSRYILSKFEMERQDSSWRIFIHASLTDIEHMLDILPQIPAAQHVNLVLLFAEQEVNENSQDLDLMDAELKKFHELGYELALLMKDRNLLLKPEFYNNFDYFVAGAAMVGEIKKDNRIRLSIHALIEQLLDYRKPIVATDLENWQAIELIIKSGITYLSSDTISASNDMLLPIEKKKIEKLRQMNDRFN